MLKITKFLYEAIRKHGEETYPYECCGVLLGQMDDDSRTVTSTERAGNTRTAVVPHPVHADLSPTKHRPFTLPTRTFHHPGNRHAG